MKKTLFGLFSISLLATSAIFAVGSDIDSSENEGTSKHYFSYGINNNLQFLPTIGYRAQYEKISIDTGVSLETNLATYGIYANIGLLYNFKESKDDGYYIGIKGKAGMFNGHTKKISDGIWSISPNLVIGKEKKSKNKFVQIEVSPFTKFEGMKIKTNPTASVVVGYYF